jgi:hypothetical protein
MPVSQATGSLNHVSESSESRRERMYYGAFLPLGVLTNLVLGVVILTGLMKTNLWADWLQVGAGALCCAIAGWLAAAAWSRSYFNRSRAQQIAVWRRISDTFFTWVESVPVPAESVTRLKASLDEALPTPQQN